MCVKLLTNNFLLEKAIGKSKDVHLAVLRVLPEVIRESVDADASSKSVIIYDPATGEKKMVSPTAVDGIESLGEVKTAEQREAEINARMQDTIQSGKDWLEGNVANPVGMQIQLGDGRIATIEAMHEDGKSAIATLPDGTQFLVPNDVLQRIVNNGQYADYKARRDAEASKREAEQSTESASETATEGGQPLPEEASPKEEESREYAQGDVFDVVVDGQKMHAEIVSPKDADGRFVVNVDDGESMRTLYVTPEELAAMEYREEPSPKVEETRLTTEDSSEKALERGAQPTEEHAPTALERIPRDEKGNAQFHDVDTETAWDGLVEMSGNEETAHKVAEASLANAEKRLKAAKALKEKGETPEELLRSIKENEKAAAEAQRVVDAWKAIVGEKARREEAAKAEAERIATEKAEAERKAAEERERAEAEEKTRVEAERKAEEERKTKEEERKERDENGQPFVVSSDGTTTFGEITEDTGLTAAPIKLSEGFQDANTGKGYGLVHIEANHGEQIRQAGFTSVKEFVSFVATHYDPDNIRVGKRRDDGSDTFLIQVTDTHDNTLFIELSKDGSYWNVNSGGIFRKGYSNKKETVAKTEPQQPTNAVSSDSSLSANVKDGITNAEPNGEPTVSLDKGTTLPADQQTSDKENTKKVADSEGENTLKAKIEAASADVNTDPTEAQKEAGNYKKGHVQVGAFDITIEQPEGSIRRGTDADGKKWESKMHNTYGYFRGTEGVDGDHIDVFLSNDIDGWNGRKVFVVDQYNPDGTFDEHKVMLGFNDMDEAKSDYLANYEKGWENGRRITVSTTNLEDFEKWIDSSHRKTKPFSEYSSVNKETVATDKGGEKAEKKQKKQSVFDKAKEIADKEEKKRKAEAEDDSALGQATRAVGKKKKVNRFKYTVSEKNSNSALRGVHYANGYAYASDGYILFKEKADYPKEWEGTTRDKDGNLIDGKYPDTEKAILRFVHIPDKEVESLPSKGVLDFAIAAGKKLKVEAIPVAVDGIFFNAVALKKFLEAVASKGMDRVVYRHPMLYATNGKDEIVMMPTVNTLEGALDIADRMESAGLPKEQIDAWKAHIEAADKKMSFEDFQNAEKNAKRKGVRLTEAESPKRKADERYQRGEGGVKPSKAEVALRDAVIDRLRESGMDVIADEAEGQRVLDEVNGRAKVQMGDAPETFAERQKQAVESHGVVMPGLNESYVEVVKDIPRHEYTGSIAEATREAIDAAKRKYAGKELTYNNYGANFNYTISANAIDICLSPKHQNLSANKGIHLALAEHLDEVINKSVEVEEHPDYIKGKDGKRGEEVNPNAIMHRFYGVAVIDGTPCRVMTLMREDGRSEEANGVHSYEVQKIEVLDNESPSTSNGVGTQMKDLSAYPLAKLLKGVEKSYDKGKYLLDESKKRSVGLREQRVDGADGVRFFRTANGEAYGFTVGGRIYIDPRIATSETPVHEYAHLWAEALRNGNPKEWQNVVELMKGTKVWDEVKARYPELKSDDEIADEVIATYSGRRGAERLREEQRKIAEGNGGVFEKAEAVNALERVKQALKKFWNGVADFLHIHYKSAEEVADRVMKDLLEGVDPRKMGKTKDGGVRFSAKQKRALETASLGNVPRSLTVVSSAAGANVLNNIENLAKEFEKSATQPKTFIGDVAKALGASRFGSGSEYATFETKNGNIVTIRLANHNAHVSGFDHNDKDNGISIVISPKPNEGITNDGNAHITEFYYDSIKLRRAEGKPLAEIVRSIKQALYSGEFKDTTGLAERQEVNGEDVIRYQSSSENSDKTLAGVHNITEEKLRKALKLGGLANPSVAVIDISKNSHEGFGEISLILPSEKVAKRTGKNAGTWQGDAWTPTYPQIERRMSNKGAEKASKDVLSVPSDMYSEVRIGLDRWLDSGEANSAMAYMFLHEKGVAPEPKKIQPKFSDEAYNELKSITAGNFNIYGISKADAQKVLAMYIDAYFDGDKDLYEDKTKAWLEKNRSIVDAGDKGGMRYAIAKENVKLYDEYGFNYRGVQTFVRDVEYDHRNTGVDMNATLNEVEDYIKTNSLTDEFNTWQEGKEKEYGIKEVIFDGFTPSGNRRYIPNTLENVSKIMKKQGRNGATGAWASFPNFAARLMPSYGTLEDIRSKKGLLTSDREKIDDFREKWSKVFFELGMKCQPDATGTFDDYGFDRLSEAAMTSDPQAFLKQEYNVDFSDEDTKRLKKMVKAIKEEYPAMYFETKFERPVYLNEFAAVVVPNDLGADVKKALSDLGIAMYEYDASKEGDRSRAFDEAVKSSGKIRFQFIGEKGAAEADHAEEVFANENVERSVRESRSEKTDLTAEERELRDNLVERMRKGGLDVVTDSEEMQRVIDTENERTRNKRSKKSEAARKRDEALYAVDWSTAFVSGKSREEATEIRRERGRKFKEETKELYGRVLSGNFDDVTLRLIDEFIDKSTPNNPYERPISKRLPTRALQKMRGGERTGSVDALFSRICESTVGKDGKTLPRAERERAIEEKKKELLKKWAIATGNWHTDVSDFSDGKEPIGSGTDSDVYLSKDGKSVIKVSKGKPYGKRFRPDVDNVALFNTVFPGSRYTIEGYGEIDGKFVRFLKQPFVDFSDSTPLTEGERVAYMEKLGFKPINKENTAFSNGEIVASDLQKSNVVRDRNGNVRVIDADMKLHTKDVGGNYSYPDVETDTTGLAEREEVNTGSVREHRVYHGSGADFDAFDHSHMGEGEGAQAYGWGTYVTEVEGIGRTYAIQNTTTHNDALRALQHDVDAISDQLDRHRDDLKYDEEQLKRANEWRAEAELDYELFKDEAEKLKEKYGESSPEYRNHLFNDIYTDEMKRAQSSVKSTEESIQYRKEKISELEKALKDKQAEIDELPKEFPRHLYTVEIPDDNGSNYLDWNGHPAESLLKDVGSFLESEGFERVQDSPVRYEKSESTVVLNPNATGADLYAELREALGSDKKASQALAELGCIGIKYPADNMRGGREDGSKNYVIFNENDAKITDHTRFLRTAGGEVYGLVKDGRIYLDPKVATAETAVHEYTHLWGDMLRRKDSEQWNHTVKELKNSVLWEEVKELYPELKTDDEIADEVLSTFSGRRGAERLREEARRVAEGEGGVFTKAKAIETLERVKEAIARFWEGMAKMFGINRYRSAEELADMAMKDLLDSKNPMKDESGMRKRGEVGERESVFDVADRVSQNLEERTRAMGSRVEKRMADVAQKLEGKELSMEQKAVVDVFSGKSDNQKFSVKREDGKKQTYLLKQGNEEKAGAKHSLYRHYGTNSGVITADDVLKIPQVLERGERIEKAKGGKKMAVYTMDIDGAKYIVLTRVGKNNEIVDDFYSNKEGSESSVYRNAENIDNTPEGARRKDSEPSAKVEDKSESPKLFGEEIIDDGKKGSDSIDRSVRENPKNEDKPRLSRKPGESIFDYASRVSDSVDRSVRERVSARDEYEKKVKSKGFQTKEALQNSMLGLQEFMFAIDHASGNKRYIEDIPDFENPILGENRLSSVNKEEMHQVAKTQFKPLMSAVAKLSGNGKESGELYDYMFAKHGLERDAVMRQREAQKEFDKYQKAHPKGTKTIEDFVASLEGKDYAGLTALTAEDGRVKSIQSQIDAIDEQMKATDNQLLLRNLGGQKKRLKVDLLNAARDAADDIRKAFESNPSHDRSDINELWSRVNEVNGNTLRKLYESGMLTKEAYNDISSMYTNYIPMRGFDQTTSADAYAYLTHSDSAFNAPIKTAKGRSSKADNPIAYMQAMAESAIMQGNRNVLVKQKMLNFVRNHPSDLASVSDVWLQYDSVADEWKPVYAFGRESKG